MSIENRRAELVSARLETSRILLGKDKGLIALVGACAAYGEKQQIDEAIRLHTLKTLGLLPISRLCTQKPRSPVQPSEQQPWKGLETTDIRKAMQQVVKTRKSGAHIGMELLSKKQAALHEKELTCAWLGARSHGDDELDAAMTSSEMVHVPLGIKNGLDGNFDSSIARINKINAMRHDKVENPAPAILIYRGGEDFRTPDEWIDQVLRAYDATNGAMILDTAHGSERAFDPNKQFKKSIVGQIACLEQTIILVEDGMGLRGIMIEASDFIHPDPYFQTDPNMPFGQAVEGVTALHTLIMNH